MAASKWVVLRAVLKRFGLFLLVWFGAHSLYVCMDGMSQAQRTADVAVVLGTTVHPSGRVSPWLEARLQRGLQLYQQKQVRNIMVSGGVGVEQQDEAQVMRQYLIQHGVPDQAIWVDSHGSNTGLSAKHTLQLMDKNGWYNAIVVSQFFHVSRAKMQFQRAGIREVETASPKVFSVLEYTHLWREWVAYYVYLLGVSSV